MIYRLAKKNEAKTCGKMMGQSFQHYGFFDMYPLAQKKHKKFTNAIEMTEAVFSQKRGELLVGVEEDKIVSAAVLQAPSTKQPDLWDYVSAGGLRVLFAGGLKATLGWYSMLKEADAAVDSLKQPHWYLSTLAVDDHQKGKGLGSQMIQDGIIPFIRSNGGGLLTLITNSEGNVHFYVKNGFTIFHHNNIERNHKKIGNWSLKLQIPMAVQSGSSRNFSITL